MRKKEKILRGIPVSSGYIIGRTFIYENFFAKLSAHPIKEQEISQEITRFEAAIDETEQELKELYEQVKREMGRDLAEFISVQISLLKDQDTLQKTKDFIKENKSNAEF
ncbi:MAG: hypothetical protein OEZ20_10000, partial [candidate division WOR-3 bacterium]|nr:hypothetical protein [candidate division WOR-3 bacterium]